MLGVNEITYLHSLIESEREERISNIVKYDPPCIIMTDNEQRLKYLPRFCQARGFHC